MCVVWIVLWVDTYVGVGVLCVWGLGHVAVYYVFGKVFLEYTLCVVCAGVHAFVVCVCLCVCVYVSVHLLYESDVDMC